MAKELSVSQILDAVNSGAGVKTLSPIMKCVAGAVSETKDGDKLLLEAIRYDVALSLNLLRAANRPGHYEEHAVDIESAVDRIGLKTVRNLAISTEFVDVESGLEENETEYKMLQWIWERSLFIATSAKQLVENLGNRNKDHFHTLGLLLDIGVHFLLNNFTEQYLPVLERWRDSGEPLVDHEHDLLGIDHTIVGQHLAHTWNLGLVFENAIRYHHSTESQELDEFHSAVIQMSNQVGSVFFMMPSTSMFESIYNSGVGKFWRDKDELSNLLQRVALEADKAAFLVSTGTSTVSSIDLLRFINTELSRATLSYDEMVSELESAMRKAEMLTQKLEEANKQLRAAANIDPLTKIYNRRYFEEFLNWNFQRAKRYKSTLGCLMIDIDFFKKFNDSYGHLTGDRILQGVSELLRKSLRVTDILSRFGGEEFTVLLPETNPGAVLFTARKLHKIIEEASFDVEGKSLKVTISIGHHYYNGSDSKDIEVPNDLVRLADANVYEAKRNGRNQVWPQEIL